MDDLISFVSIPTYPGIRDVDVSDTRHTWCVKDGGTVELNCTPEYKRSGRSEEDPHNFYEILKRRSL